ncbi:G-protein coupled receptor 4 [Latimeria chalumnae]|uniref:G-protein coupled receptor 4 n=1 Tax=Latimeria chalumnae TaxID=7897 RepID=UPI0003C1AD3C|nr:PREDICTED: G-protein coupled receptor 4-like [Latimeria chalumnae]|eukprot:XP_005989871.1 PREDICTED: G-protein coupled receptor 4-like [Latimeria chalumnae]
MNFTASTAVPSLCNITLSSNSSLLASFYCVSFILGLPANCFAFWALIQLIRAKHILPVYIISLTLADFLQLTTLPVWATYVLEGHKWPFSSAYCEFCGFLFYVNLYSSVGFLCCIAMDRYLAIVHPLRSAGLRSPKSALLVSVCIWLFVIGACILGMCCSIYRQKTALCLEDYPGKTRYAIFKIGTIVLGFLLPCFILGFTCIQVAKCLQKSISVQPQERQKVICILVLVMVIFVLVFGPYHVLGAYKFITFLVLTEEESYCQLERALFLPYRACYGLTSFNNVLDPLFYIFICNDIQERLRDLFSCIPKLNATES